MAASFRRKSFLFVNYPTITANQLKSWDAKLRTLICKERQPATERNNDYEKDVYFITCSMLIIWHDAC